MSGRGLAHATINLVGLMFDLRARGLSREDARAVLAEIDRRQRLYREDPNVVPPYRSDEEAS